MSVVDFAVALTQRGYSVYPVNVTLDERGEKSFSFKENRWAAGEYPTEPDDIAAHWDGFQGLIVNTGRSGVVLVDIDTKHGNDGFAALRAAGIELPDTPVKVRSWTGGEHWYYREGETPVSTSQNLLAQGVDIRARGGIAVAPPTEVDGKPYTFLDPRSMVPVSELPEFPRELAELLSPKKSSVKTVDEQPALTSEQRKLMERKLDRTLRDLSTMEDGNRNATMRLRMIRLFGIAKTLGEDDYNIAQLAREAYFESGGSAERELEQFIDWAMEHAKYELPTEETDEAFEAEVAQIIRRQKAQDVARRRLNPIKVKAVSDDDILEFDPALSDDDYLVEGLVPRGETVILFGPPNAGKSFAAIDLAMGVATGLGVWGRKAKRGRVLYLAGEGTRRLAARRRAWEVFHEKEAVGGALQLRKMRLILDNDDSVAEHAELIQKFGADLIVVDTMLRAAEGLTLEDPGCASRVIAQLDRVREIRPGATVVVLHHPPESNPDKPSGSYPLRGNVDTILKLTNEAGIRTMSITKSREGDTGWSGQFNLQDMDIPGSRLSSAVFLPAVSPTRSAVQDFTPAAEDDGDDEYYRRALEDPFN